MKSDVHRPWNPMSIAPEFRCPYPLCSDCTIFFLVRKLFVLLLLVVKIYYLVFPINTIYSTDQTLYTPTRRNLFF